MVKATRSERDLRSWLRGIWHNPMFWIEPARGGSVGTPDVILLHDGYFYPVELKVAKRTRNGLKAQIRPSQIRFHYRCAKGNGKTALLFLVDHEIYFLAGSKCPTKNELSYLTDEDFILVGVINDIRDKRASALLVELLEGMI